MSVQAIVWVLEDCPDLPKHLVASLVGLANHADQNGRGAYPSQELLAWYARKDERSVRRDLEQLVELELIEPGDQRMVLHLPADKRPVVYDLMIHRKRPPRPDARKKPGRPKKEQVNQPVENREDAHVPPDADVKNGGTWASNREDAHVPRTVLEPSDEPSPSPSRTSGSAHASAVTENGTSLGGDDRELLTAACRTANAARAGAPGWTVRQCGEAAQAALGAGHDPATVAARLVELAHDKACAFPTMLVADLAVTAARAVQATRPAPETLPAVEDLGEPDRYRHAPVVPPGAPRCHRHPDQPAGPACRLCEDEKPAEPLTDAQKRAARAEAIRKQLAAKPRAGDAPPGRRRRAVTTVAA